MVKTCPAEVKNDVMGLLRQSGKNFFFYCPNCGNAGANALTPVDALTAWNGAAVGSVNPATRATVVTKVIP